jgi:TolA-binding protein
MATLTHSESTSTPTSPTVSIRGRDGFFQVVYRFFDALSKKRGLLAGAIGALVLAGIGVGIWSNRAQERAEQAKSALFIAQKSFEEETRALAGVKLAEAPKPTPAAKEGAPKDEAADKAAREARAKQAKQNEEDTKKLEAVVYQKLDVDAKYVQTLAKYRAVIEQYPGTQAAFEARLGLGDLYYAHGDSARALPVFQEAFDKTSGSHNKAVALSSVGYAQENQGKTLDALNTFQKALDLGETGLKGDLLLAIARCQEALHDTAKAKATYEQIISQLPNTESSRTAELLKAQL